RPRARPRPANPGGVGEKGLGRSPVSRRIDCPSLQIWYVCPMRVDFAFGKTGLITELPDGFRYRVLQAQSAKPLALPNAGIEQALDAPIASPPLEDLARGKSSAAISLCDITRPAPNRQTLPAVLARLKRAGIPREGITILI